MDSQEQWVLSKVDYAGQLIFDMAEQIRTLQMTTSLQSLELLSLKSQVDLAFRQMGYSFEKLANQPVSRL